MSRAPFTGLFESTNIFFVIFQKSHGEACKSKCFILGITNLANFFITCWSLGYRQHHPHVKNFTRCWWNPYQSPNGESLFAGPPPPFSFVVNKFRYKLTISEGDCASVYF